MNNDQNTVIHLKNVSKTFHLWEQRKDSIRQRVFSLWQANKQRDIQALQGVDLKVYKGECIGIIGRNGSGKSTLLKIMIGAIKPDAGGEVEVHGKIIRLALGMGFDPGLSARDNIYLNASLLGLTFKKIGQKFQQIIDFAELEDFVDTKIKFYSSGMRSRLAFSIAIHADADIFLMDEFFGGVGDVSFQEKSAQVFQEAVVQGNTIVLVSHQLGQIRQFCNRVLWFDQGRLRAEGPPNEILPQYQAMYAQQKIHPTSKTA